jgi:hypothetical protein
MAFPQIAGTAVTQDTVNATSRACNLPANIASGNLLLLFVTLDNTGNLDTPTDWSLVYNTGNLTNHRCFAKVATGSEGSTVTVTSASEQLTAIAARITGWYGSLTGVEAAATANTGTSGSPDPPSLTASWGAADNLWIGVFGIDSTATLSSYPASLPNNRTFQVGGPSGAGTGIASAEDAGATFNPGNFSTTPTEDWCAQTVVVRPAGGAPPSPYVTIKFAAS